MTMDHDLHAMRMRRAAQSLEGLSCGDAFGESFFLPTGLAESMIEKREVPAPPWFFTDDTIMALSILEILAEHREIKPDSLPTSLIFRANRVLSQARERRALKSSSGRRIGWVEDPGIQNSPTKRAWLVYPNQLTWHGRTIGSNFPLSNIDHSRFPPWPRLLVTFQRRHYGWSPQPDAHVTVNADSSSLVPCRVVTF
jgi:hypothetical protein